MPCNNLKFLRWTPLVTHCYLQPAAVYRAHLGGPVMEPSGCFLLSHSRWMEGYPSESRQEAYSFGVDLQQQPVGPFDEWAAVSRCFATCEPVGDLMQVYPCCRLNLPCPYSVADNLRVCSANQSNHY